MANHLHSDRARSQQGRGDSIFSDDDEERGFERERRSGERGLFRRAGEEVRSWFGEPERRGEQNWNDDMGKGSFSQTSGGGSPFDDPYRSWREKQIEELDREYDEYRQHRQQQFESDFTSWRQNRQNPGPKGLKEGTSATSGSPSSPDTAPSTGAHTAKGPRGRKS